MRMVNTNDHDIGAEVQALGFNLALNVYLLSSFNLELS